MADEMPIQTDAVSEEHMLIQQQSKALEEAQDEISALKAKIASLKAKRLKLKAKLLTKKAEIADLKELDAVNEKDWNELSGLLEAASQAFFSERPYYGSPSLTNFLRACLKAGYWPYGDEGEIFTLDSDEVGAIQLIVGESGPITATMCLRLVKEHGLCPKLFFSRNPLVEGEDIDALERELDRIKFPSLYGGEQ